MIRFVPTYTQSALDTLAIERKETTAERDAFAAFHDRISSLDATQNRSIPNNTQGTGIQVALKPPPENQLQDAREAYRETVMSVSHYEDEYDESLAENLSGEFAPEVAVAMTTGESFTSQLRERLLEESRQARDDRATFRSGLTHEGDSLRTADETITAITTDLGVLTEESLDTWSADQLADTYETLLTAEHRCDELAATRQTTLHTTQVPGPTYMKMDLQPYLYQSLPVTYPVLTDLAELGDTLRAARQRVERGLDSPCSLDDPRSESTNTGAEYRL